MHISSGSKPPAAHGLQTGQGPRMIQPQPSPGEQRPLGQSLPGGSPTISLLGISPFASGKEGPRHRRIKVSGAGVS